MDKYQGKYSKCRTCKNAKEVLMVMVVVSEEFSHAVQFSSGTMVDKYTCEKCDDWGQDDESSSKAKIAANNIA